MKQIMFGLQNGSVSFATEAGYVFLAHKIWESDVLPPLRNTFIIYKVVEYRKILMEYKLMYILYFH